MASKQKKVKQCWTMVRYVVNRNGSVCHTVRNEQGKEYHTWLHANGSAACDCAAKGSCYHIEHVRKAEAARKPPQVAEVAAPATVETSVTVDAQPAATARKFGGHRYSQREMQARIAAHKAAATDLGQRGNLNGSSQGFSILRKAS